MRLTCRATLACGLMRGVRCRVGLCLPIHARLLRIVVNDWRQTFLGPEAVQVIHTRITTTTTATTEIQSLIGRAMHGIITARLAASFGHWLSWTRANGESCITLVLHTLEMAVEPIDHIVCPASWAR